MEDIKFESAPKKQEENNEKENKNPFDLTDKQMDELYSDNDNSEMWKKY